MGSIGNIGGIVGTRQAGISNNQVNYSNNSPNLKKFQNLPTNFGPNQGLDGPEGRFMLSQLQQSNSLHNLGHGNQFRNVHVANFGQNVNMVNLGQNNQNLAQNIVPLNQTQGNTQLGLNFPPPGSFQPQPIQFIQPHLAISRNNSAALNYEGQNYGINRNINYDIDNQGNYNTNAYNYQNLSNNPQIGQHLNTIQPGQLNILPNMPNNLNPTYPFVNIGNGQQIVQNNISDPSKHSQNSEFVPNPIIIAPMQHIVQNSPSFTNSTVSTTGSEAGTVALLVGDKTIDNNMNNFSQNLNQNLNQHFNQNFSPNTNNNFVQNFNTFHLDSNPQHSSHSIPLHLQQHFQQSQTI